MLSVGGGWNHVCKCETKIAMHVLGYAATCSNEKRKPKVAYNGHETLCSPLRTTGANNSLLWYMSTGLVAVEKGPCRWTPLLWDGEYFSGFYFFYQCLVITRLHLYNKSIVCFSTCMFLLKPSWVMSTKWWWGKWGANYSDFLPGELTAGLFVAAPAVFFPFRFVLTNLLFVLELQWVGAKL